MSPPYSLDMVSSVVTSYVTFLLGLVERGDWDRFESSALSNPRFFESVCDALARADDSYNGMTLLHACVRREDAPADVLARMIDLYPQALRQGDCMGRTPLHVAAGTGADPRTIGLLAVRYPRACKIRDDDGRTPLHHACDARCEMFEGDEGRPARRPKLETVQVLLMGSFEAVVLEDNDERSALELAILSDAPGEVVSLLLKTTQDVNRRRSERHDLIEDFPSSSSEMHRSLSETSLSSLASIGVH